jgi:hypothetical protein
MANHNRKSLGNDASLARSLVLACIGNLAALAFPLYRTTCGTDLARPSPSEATCWPSDRYSSGDFVERRAGNVIGFNLRGSLNDRANDLHNLRVSSAVVGLGTLGFVP